VSDPCATAPPRSCLHDTSYSCASTAALSGTVSNNLCLEPGGVMQADQSHHCIQAEAFQVELPVVMAAAEAILGEAEVLAVVVGCEELPHHFNSPRRLPDNCKVRPCKGTTRPSTLPKAFHFIQPSSTHVQGEKRSPLRLLCTFRASNCPR
jgi:hypothetical protein